jgi:GNAT superfamily N-acetyltransferase
MITRELQEHDIPSIIHLGGRMHEESQYSSLTYNPEKVLDKCNKILEVDYMIGIIAEQGNHIVGMMGGVIGPYEYGEELISSDILVYILPEFRGTGTFIKLVNKYIAWSKEKGAKKVFLSQSTGVNIDSITQLYHRLGFAYVGGQFCMEI